MRLLHHAFAIVGLLFSACDQANQDPEGKARAWERNPDGFLFIKRHVLPRLLELGVAEDAVRKLNEDNVRRFFEET